jgi:hypothetical protein
LAPGLKSSRLALSPVLLHTDVTLCDAIKCHVIAVQLPRTAEAIIATTATPKHAAAICHTAIMGVILSTKYAIVNAFLWW